MVALGGSEGGRGCCYLRGRAEVGEGGYMCGERERERIE